MNKDTALHLVIMVMCIAVGTACGLLGAPVDRYVAMLEPILFFSMLSGVLSNGFYPFVAGAVSPFILYLLLGDQPLVPVYLSRMCAYAFGGMTAGLLYVFLNNSFVAAVGGIAASRIVFGAAGIIGWLSVGQTYDIGTYLNDAVITTWPGIAASLILIPLLSALLKKTGAMQELHPKINYNR